MTSITNVPLMNYLSGCMVLYPCIRRRAVRIWFLCPLLVCVHKIYLKKIHFFLIQFCLHIVIKVTIYVGLVLPRFTGRRKGVFNKVLIVSSARNDDKNIKWNYMHSARPCDWFPVGNWRPRIWMSMRNAWCGDLLFSTFIATDCHEHTFRMSYFRFEL